MPLFNVGNEFKDRYRSYTSEHLIKIVTTEKNNHSPETIAAAEAILRERGIDPRQAGQRQRQPTSPVTHERYGAPAKAKKFDWRIIIWAIVIIRVIYGLVRLAQHK